MCRAGEAGVKLEKFREFLRALVRRRLFSFEKVTCFGQGLVIKMANGKYCWASFGLGAHIKAKQRTLNKEHTQEETLTDTIIIVIF